MRSKYIYADVEWFVKPLAAAEGRWGRFKCMRVDRHGPKAVYFAGPGGGFVLDLAKLDEGWAYLEKHEKTHLGTYQYRIPRKDWDRLQEA